MLSTAYSFTDLLTVLMLGLIANMLLGGPRALYRRLALPNPGALFPHLIRNLEKKLNRPHRDARSRAIRGVILLLFIIALAWGLATLAHRLSLALPYGSLLYILLVALLIQPRRLYDEAREIATSLDILGEELTRPLLATIARRDTNTLDKHTAVRATIEHLAENFADHIVAPACWFVVLGLPGLLLARMVNTADSIVGHTSTRFAAFGAATARVDTLINLIPARLAGALLVMAALFIPACKPWASLRVMWQQAHRFTSTNSGWPVAAMAGALSLTLGGPRAVEKVRLDDPWVGTGTAKATTNDLRRATALLATATLLLVIICAGVLYVMG